MPKIKVNLAGIGAKTNETSGEYGAYTLELREIDGEGYVNSDSVVSLTFRTFNAKNDSPLQQAQAAIADAPKLVAAAKAKAAKAGGAA